MPASAADALASVPLFSHLSGRSRRKLQRGAVEHRYDPDTTIVRERGRTPLLFVVLDGSVKVVRNGRTISRRREGEYFGEISLIDGRPSSASVISETPVRCLVLDQESVRKFLAAEPRASWALLESLASRLRGE
jgi:CRP/FNR family transcriptional regulator, cyclic AMP receptor protein